MTVFRIRDYREEDFIQVTDLWQETGLSYPARQDTEESIRNCLKIGGKFLVMIEDSSDLIIGTSWMTFDGRRIFLHHFGIKREYQRKGLGKMLAKASLDFIHSAGYQVKLEVHKDNNPARHLYNSLGFFAYTDYDIFMIRDVKNIPPENRYSY